MRHPWSIARRIGAIHMLLVAVIALFSVWVAYVQARDVAVRASGGRVPGEAEILAAARLPDLVATFALLAVVGILISALVARYLDRVTLGRGPEELAEQFLLAEAAMDAVELGIAVLAPDGRVRLLNDAAAASLGPSAARDGRLPAPLALALERSGTDEFTVALGDRVLVVQQHVIAPRGRGRQRVTHASAGLGAGPDALEAAAREGVDAAPDGTRVLTLHDRTALQRLSDDLTVAHTLGAALRAQTHEHANQLHTALSLVESGRLDAAKEVLARHRRPAHDADGVVGALLDAKAAEAAERGVELTCSVDLTEPSELSPLDLITVVGGLVDNAVDAAAGADEDGRWVDVEVSADGDGLVVQVADGGAGLTAAHAERAFERGWTTKPAGADGRGLGLWLVRRIVEGAGGTVDVATDSGTVFRAEVPRG